MRNRRNRTLTSGAVVLSIWSGLNLLVGAAVTAMILIGRAPPALAMVVPDGEIASLDARALAVVNAQAALANPLIVALCLLVLAIIWTSLVDGARWAFWALVAGLVPLQIFGFISDDYLGHHNLTANVVSSLVLLCGLALARIGTLRT